MAGRKPRSARAEFHALREILKTTPIGLVVADLERRLLFANPAFCFMLGCSEEEILSKSWNELSPPEDASKEQILFDQLRAGSTYHFHSDKRLLRRDGSLAAGHWSVWSLGNRESPFVLAMITDKGQTELARRETEEHFRDLADIVPVMIWTSGIEGLCTYNNKRWLEFTGRSFEEQLGDPWVEGVHPEDGQRCLETYKHAFDSRQPFEMEYRLRRHDGEYRWVLGSGVPRFDRANSFAGYVVSCIDITERKQAAETLSLFSRKLIEAQEEERTRIARELHDDISQRLALVSLSLEALTQSSASADELKQEIAEANKQVSDLATDVQALSHRLHSSKLAQLGLVGAAASFCRELSSRQDVQIEFRSEDVPIELPQDISLCLFRVLQEAVQNTIKHAETKHLRVSLRNGSKEIELIVRDDGKGFDPESAMKGRGIGLVSMKERLKLLNGSLAIESQPKRGTTIQARVPFSLEMKSARTAG
jgi:PAS domain S-box-containing protein